MLPASPEVMTRSSGAGANLATVSTHTARDRNGPKIVHQLLVYPVVDTPQAEGHFLYDSHRGMFSTISALTLREHHVMLGKGQVYAINQNACKNLCKTLHVNTGHMG